MIVSVQILAVFGDFHVFKAAHSPVCSALSKLQPLESWQAATRALRTRQTVEGAAHLRDGGSALPHSAVTWTHDTRAPGATRQLLRGSNREVAGYCLTLCLAD